MRPRGRWTQSAVITGRTERDESNSWDHEIQEDRRSLSSCVPHGIMQCLWNGFWRLSYLGSRASSTMEFVGRKRVKSASAKRNMIHRTWKQEWAWLIQEATSSSGRLGCSSGVGTEVGRLGKWQEERMQRPTWSWVALCDILRNLNFSLKERRHRGI